MATGDGRWERLNTGAALEAPHGWGEVRETAAALWVLHNTTRWWVIYGRGRRPDGFLAPPEAVETAEAEAALAAFTGERIRWQESDTTSVPAPPRNGPAATRNLTAFVENMQRAVFEYLRFDDRYTAEAGAIADRLADESVSVLKVPAGLPFDPTVSPSAARLMARSDLVGRLRHQINFGYNRYTIDLSPDHTLSAALDQLAETRLDSLLAERRGPGAPPDEPLDLDALCQHLKLIAPRQSSSSFALWRDLDLPTIAGPARRAAQQQAARKRHADRKAGQQVPLRRRTVAECGTPAGYRRHRRLNESPCDQCRQAEAEAVKARRVRTS